MVILIAGANGLIGRDLVKNLSKNYKIIAIYRSNKKNIIKNKNVQFIKHDFSKNLKFSLSLMPDYLVNCIATHEFSKKKNYFEYYNSNVRAVKNLVSYGEKNKIKMLINLSTISIYGEVKKKSLNENYKPINQNTLSKTKLLGEKILKRSDLNYVNLRLPGVLVQSNKVKNRPWLNNMINQIKNNKNIKAFNVHGKFNNLISSDEIANLISYLIKKKIKIRDNFNFACSKPITILEILKTVKFFFNSKSSIVKMKSKKKLFLISTKKIEKKIGYTVPLTKKILKKHIINLK